MKTFEQIAKEVYPDVDGYLDQIEHDRIQFIRGLEYSDKQKKELLVLLAIEKMNSENSEDSYNVIIHELKEQLAESEKIKNMYDRTAKALEMSNDSLKDQLAEKTEALENSENGMLNLIKYKNELVQQLEQKEFELKAADTDNERLNWELAAKCDEVKQLKNTVQYYINEQPK
jgi:chromosome segregation ATPase